MQNLYEQAKQALLLANPDHKLDFTLQLASHWDAGMLEWQEGEAPQLTLEPGRLDKPPIVGPSEVSKRKFGKQKGRAELVHALAHIELTAVNLALDSIYRYRDMPQAYYADWMQCAREESTHFFALRERLREMGYDYGDFPAHNELWKMAVTTADYMMDRMGIVHRVFEARALDVVPKAIEKFDQFNDPKMVKVLTMIANEEVGHVSSGTRWFHYRCAEKGVDPDQTFIDLLWKYMKEPLKGPFNYEARLKAGFTEKELRMMEAMGSTIPTP